MSRGGSATYFLQYGQPLSNVKYFKYLDSLMLANYDDCPELVSNLNKLQKKFIEVLHILGQEVSDTKTSGMLYKSAV